MAARLHIIGLFLLTGFLLNSQCFQNWDSKMNLTNLGRSEKDSYNGCDSNVEVYLFLYQTPHNPSRQSDLCKVQSSNLMVLSLCLCFLLRIVSCVPSPIQSSTISRFVLSVSVFFGWCAGSAVQGASPRISCQESWFFFLCLYLPCSLWFSFGFC